MTPAKAGTSAVLAVVGAAVLLLVLVTWAASIGPDRVLSGGHVDPLAPLTPTSSTPVVGDEPDPIERARDEHRADEAPAWVRLLALTVQLLGLLLAGYLLFRFGIIKVGLL